MFAGGEGRQARQSEGQGREGLGRSPRRPLARETEAAGGCLGLSYKDQDDTFMGVGGQIFLSFNFNCFPYCEKYHLQERVRVICTV